MKDMDEKIKWAAKMADTKYSHLEVEVDGGVGVKTAALAAGSGANVLVAGSAVFGAADASAAVKEIREISETAAANI